MWTLKILNGPQAGKMIQLEFGNQTLGRSDQATIKVASQSISKLHAHFIVTEDKVIISDNKSSNGVVVNGVKIQNKVLKTNDKFYLGEIFFELIKLPKFVSILPYNAPHPPQSHGNNALAVQNFDMVPVDHGEQMDMEKSLKDESGSQQLVSFQDKVENYVENVALPGIYEYSGKFDLKYVVMGFILIFIILVTTLSVIPVIQVSHGFVIDESARRADSLARLLVQENREFIVNKNEISVNVRSVRNELGVDKAFIIDALDGHVIAPANQRENYPKIPFIQRARKKNHPYKEVLDNAIGVSRPILYNNPLTGEPSPAAYAIILYNMDRVALDIPRTLSLIIQILIITLLAGSLLYFLLYKVITKPLYNLNSEINTALKEGNNNIEIQTPTPVFQNLVANINSALSRMNQENESEIQVDIGDKTMEASELVELFPIPAIAISSENEMILAQNDFLDNHPLFDESHIKDKYVDDLADSSLVESLKDLLEKAGDNPNQKHTNTLPASNGEQFEISIKSIQEMKQISYHLVCFTEIYEEDGLEE